MVKKLTKQDVSFWENKVECAYSSFRGRVRDTVPKVDFSEVNGIIKPILIKALCDRVVKEVNECSDIHTGVWISGLSPHESFEYVPDDLKKRIDDLETSRCHLIRSICDEAHTKRDYFIMQLHSSPEVEILKDIEEWIKDLDSQYPSKSCSL